MEPDLVKGRALGPASERTGRAWLGAWWAIAGLAVANGVLREGVLVPRLGERHAHQASTGLLVGGIWGTAAALSRVRPLPDRRTAARVGAAWAGCTVLFETGLGLARGMAFDEITADYDVRAGRLWALVPLSMLLAPMGVRRPVRGQASVDRPTVPGRG